ncbi:porin family protein [Botryobacter ruber]|uniref:porin family protein n=1 Tax=Botryobacter ruber TaxID=2171629 RepID=UPI000E0B1444|nr:porin family protein [Botryobacter ruber]
MKNRMFLLQLLLLSLISFRGLAQVRLGVQAGGTYSDFRHVQADRENEKALRKATSPIPGFSIGVLAGYQLSKAFSLQTGLNWTNKGERYEDKGKDMNVAFEYDQKTSVHFLEVPVQAACHIRKFQVVAGPYIGIGMLGHRKSEFNGTVNGVSETNEERLRIKFRNTLPADFAPENGILYQRRLDYGLNGGIGYQAGPALLRATYAWGLANSRTRLEGDETYKDFKSFYRVIGLSVVYWFKE